MSDEMKRQSVTGRFRASLVALLLAAVFETPSAMGGTYSNATITFIQTPTPSADCIYFMLAGVTQADPVVPNNGWFAVPSTQNGFSQIYAMLLSVKLSGGLVSVTTTGALAGGTCGSYAGIDHVAAD